MRVMRRAMRAANSTKRRKPYQRMDDELNSKLKPLRDRIDAIDAQLIALLNQRAAVALEVGEVKKLYNAPVFRPEREQQVIARLQAMSEGPLAGSHIDAI
jgi:chorismate mutase/prephenate dehydratase